MDQSESSNGHSGNRSSVDEAVYFSDHFPYKDGFLHCEHIRVVDVKKWLEERGVFPASPFFLFSKANLTSNITSYLSPLRTIRRPTCLNYALKANMNSNILKIVKDMGCSVTLVSGFELQLALKLGFEPSSIVFNGNGKQLWEIEEAVHCGCLLNIDSVFDMDHVSTVCRKLQKSARVLLRVNPDIDPGVHKYICTGKTGSKFGVQTDSLGAILDKLLEDPYVQLIGLHCHVGSTITEVAVFRLCAEVMMKLFRTLKDTGFTAMECINLGGGLGIPYRKHAAVTTGEQPIKMNGSTHAMPTPRDIVIAVDEILDDDVTLILEPGRSLIGDTGILVASVTGVKLGEHTNYIVVDGSMTEVLRPALYGAYHHIDLCEPATSRSPCRSANPTDTAGTRRLYQVVGPVCESADFLGKDRFLATPHEGCSLAVFDVGAYCGSMGSNYNMRARPAEVLVDGDRLELIRAPDTLESILAPYQVQDTSNTHVEDRDAQISAKNSVSTFARRTSSTQLER